MDTNLGGQLNEEHAASGDQEGEALTRKQDSGQRQLHQRGLVSGQFKVNTPAGRASSWC